MSDVPGIEDAIPLRKQLAVKIMKLATNLRYACFPDLRDVAYKELETAVYELVDKAIKPTPLILIWQSYGELRLFNADSPECITAVKICMVDTLDRYDESINFSQQVEECHTARDLVNLINRYNLIGWKGFEVFELSYITRT